MGPCSGEQSGGWSRGEKEIKHHHTLYYVEIYEACLITRLHLENLFYIIEVMFKTCLLTDE